MLLYSFGQDTLHKHTPISKTISYDEFHKSVELFRSDQGTLQGVSKDYPYVIGSLNGFLNDQPLGQYFLLDSTEEKTEVFFERVRQDSGIELVEESIEMPPVTGTMFIRVLGSFLSGTGGLMIIVLVISMLLYYLSTQKEALVYQLFGYKILDQCLFYAKRMILPTLLIGLLLIVPFALYMGFYSGAIFHYLLRPALLFLGLLILFQSLVVILFLLDLSFQPMHLRLKGMTNHAFVLFLSLSLKVLLLAIAVPTLFNSFDRLPDVTLFYQFKRETNNLYKDVYYFEEEGLIGRNLVETSWKERRYLPLIAENLGGFMDFYDTLSDDYPLIISEPADLPELIEPSLLALRVNENYVKALELRNSQGDIFNSDDKPTIIASSNTIQLVQDQLERLKLSLPQFHYTPFIPYSYKESDEYEDIQLIEAADESEVISFFSFPREEFTSQTSQSFILFVNFFVIPSEVSDLLFVGLQDDEIAALKETVKEFPFGEYLELKSFDTKVISIHEILIEELRSIIIQFVVVSVVLLVGYFSYRLLIEWFGKTLAVEYLNGINSTQKTIPFLLILLLLDIASLVFFAKVSPAIQKQSMFNTFFVLVGTDIVMFVVNSLMTQRRILSYLKGRN